MKSAALPLALVALLAPLPALACGPTGGEALFIGFILGAVLLTATLGQWAAVRFLGYAAASSWHIAVKMLAAIPAASLIGVGLAVGFGALAKGPLGLGIVVLCFELLVLIAGLRAAFWNHRMKKSAVVDL